MEVTIYCDAKVLEMVVWKMEKRSKEMAPSHPLYNKSYDELVPVFWKKIADAVTAHCATKHSDPIIEYAFVLGAPLDDTVFMFTPGICGRETSQTVNVEYIDTKELVVDFYTHTSP